MFYSSQRRFVAFQIEQLDELGDDMFHPFGLTQNDFQFHGIGRFAVARLFLDESRDSRNRVSQFLAQTNTAPPTSAAPFWPPTRASLRAFFFCGNVASREANRAQEHPLWEDPRGNNGFPGDNPIRQGGDQRRFQQRRHNQVEC